MKKLILILLSCLFLFAGCGEISEPAALEESEALNDLIPMVMVNDKIFIDSGEISEEARCGVMDGKITSSVPQNERPKENDQSNFGWGYDYQYGVNSIHVVIDGKWCIFKEEPGDNRAASQILGFENFFNLEDADAEYLKDILDKGKWEEGTGDCLIDVKLKIGDKTYDYHSDCGTFSYDGKSLRCDEKTKEKVNSVLEKYVVLGYEMP